MEQYISVKQASYLLGISTQAVYRLIDRGTLAGSVVGATRVVKRTAIAQLLATPEYSKRHLAAKKVPGQIELELGS